MTTNDSHNRDRPEPSDAALIAAVANGDERALRQFYERNAPWLAVRLRRSLPVSAVEDVLQETFLAVWRGAARYAGSSEPGGWLWGIARRQAALWLRKHGRTDLSFDEANGHVSESSADPAHQAIARLELQKAFAAAGNPGSASRDLARRVFIEDQSLVDIAADLEVPTGTIKSRVFKLRQTMKQALGREVEQ
ncbi:MAG: RNA polymerase sigma factor [Chloroflexia bacterium]|nr:RNA polymerase sigma factor [Chloroflexia bacterium]